jgi:hypothetical protein
MVFTRAGSSSPVDSAHAPIDLHDLTNVAAHIRGQTGSLDKQLVEADTEDGRRAFNQLISRRFLAIAFDPRPVGWRDTDAFGKIIEPDRELVAARPDD